MSNFVHVIDVDVFGTGERKAHISHSHNISLSEDFSDFSTHIHGYFSGPTNFFYNSNQFLKIKNPLCFTTFNPNQSYHHH